MKIPLTHFELIGRSPWKTRRTPDSNVRHAPLNMRISSLFTGRMRLFEFRRRDMHDASRSSPVFHNSAECPDERMTATREESACLAEEEWPINDVRDQHKGGINRSIAIDVGFTAMDAQQAASMLDLLNDASRLRHCHLRPGMLDEAFIDFAKKVNIRNSLQEFVIDLRAAAVEPGLAGRLAEIRGLTGLMAANVPALGGFPPTASMKVLVLENCNVTDANAAVIAGCTSITSLSLAHNTAITDDGIRRLAAGLQCLEQLDLRGTQCGKIGLEAVRKNCRSLKKLVLNSRPSSA